MATMDWSTQAGNAAAGYEAFLVPAMFAPFAETLVERAGVVPGARVLDIACGTGVVSRAAARRAGGGGSVLGVDLGEPTLAIARSRPAAEEAAPIDYMQADATRLALDGEAFDVVLCQQGLQFFPDRPAALTEMHRVLRRGGRLAIATWQGIERSPFIAIADALQRHLGADAAAMMRSPFTLFDGEALSRLISAAGFREVEVIQETIDCTWASHPEFARLAIGAGPIAAVFAAAPPDVQQAVADEVAERLAPHATAQGSLQMAMSTNVALASR
jgi:ubiquinone/menaquinone biosynthesis C-methylase UbiE